MLQTRSYIGWLVVLSLAWNASGEAPTYNRDIRPILAEHCFACHGPDAAARKAGLRLDRFEDATAELPSGIMAITVGAPTSSELIRRVATDDPNDRMPPPDHGHRLSEEDVTLLSDWITAGAKYERHWAYVKPQQSSPPEVNETTWHQNPIDQFILARMTLEGLSPSEEADPHTLIRRLSFDLTGLPPTIAEADAFANDNGADRVERAVDTLLARPSYGEHMARQWLDLARYADSNGYHIDTIRSMWPYRDWVIDAFNRNLPFDQFTIEQLAGDLLPNATIDQKIATGFHRNTMFNEEGGIDPEEFRTKAVVDRVGTTMNVWMGTTMSCAECHEHKYDPFSQAEFFELYAFFNNVPERGGGTFQSQAPLVTLPLDTHAQAELRAVDSVIASVSAERDSTANKLDTTLDAWASYNVRINELTTKRQSILDSAPTSLVMAEMDTPRETHIHNRGNFLDPGERVEAGVPDALHAMESVANPNRLDLAQWIVSAENPLTARVTVNRLWAVFFGRGIVETLDDFGTRGAAPSHPELLDYLAVEFIQSGWDVKAMIRLIVTSATYRQSSAVGSAKYAADPVNVWLSRGPRFRLDGEAIRDLALSTSGLLHEEIGGPPAHPYQPPGLYEEKIQTGYDVGAWPEVYGNELYRRGVYTFRRRSVPYPTFQTFDGPSFEFCTASRPRTNTPLQALTTLNDPQFVEAARVLAQRVMSSKPTTDERLVEAFRLCLTRAPREEELAHLREVYVRQLKRFTKDTDAAAALVANGRARVDRRLDTAELAAWTFVSSVLLNLDETVTKG